MPIPLLVPILIGAARVAWTASKFAARNPVSTAIVGTGAYNAVVNPEESKKVLQSVGEAVDSGVDTIRSFDAEEISDGVRALKAVTVVLIGVQVYRMFNK